MDRNFNDWITGFRNSIADYGYYTDFNKVYRNVESIKIELNILKAIPHKCHNPHYTIGAE